MSQAATRDSCSIIGAHQTGKRAFLKSAVSNVAVSLELRDGCNTGRGDVYRQETDVGDLGIWNMVCAVRKKINLTVDERPKPFDAGMFAVSAAY